MIDCSLAFFPHQTLQFSLQSIALILLPSLNDSVRTFTTGGYDSEVTTETKVVYVRARIIKL